MAEEAQAGFDIRRTLMLAGVGVVILFALLFFFFRSCASGGGNNYTVIYSDLELKDAADAIAQLKKNSITYKIEDKGKSIAVPKDKADQARLTLAEENLPAGGVVGWEIFDESKLGATDFDRRIQLIRAISGELSRTIKRIDGVENARVQIVIPETRLFATEAPPVTASVMLHLSPGFSLSPAKIKGIVHLVASSVENLQTQNVTVIDDSGRILTATGNLPLTRRTMFSTPETIISIQEEVAPTMITVETVEETQEATTEVTTIISEESLTLETTPAALSVGEKMLLRVKAKKELEQDLAGKAQEILNRFYPPQSSIVKVNVDFNIAASEDAVAMVDDSQVKINKLNAVILIDNRVDLKPELKQSTFKAVAGVIGYDRKRGDKIVLQKVPFHLASPPPAVVRGEVQKVFPPNKDEEKPFLFLSWLSNLLWLLVFIAGAVFVFVVYRIFRRKPATTVESTPSPVVAKSPPAKTSALEGVKSMVEDNPQAVADLLKGWLSEEKE